MNKFQRLATWLQAFISLVFLGGGVFFLFVAYRFSVDGDAKAAAFSGILGVGLFLAGSFSLRSAFSLRAAFANMEMTKSTFPGQPWLWRKDWASGEIRSSERFATKHIWMMALFWNGLMGSVGLLAWDEIAQTPPEGAVLVVCLLLLLVGIFLLALAIRNTRRLRKFGASTLKLSSIPAPLGGAVVGALHCQQAVAAASAVTLTLCCTRQDNDSGSSTSTILFQRETRIGRSAFRHQGGRVIIPIELPIPVDAEESDVFGADITTHWVIEVRAEVPGIDYEAAFEVPVYGRAETPVTTSAPAATVPAATTSAFAVNIQPTSHGGIEIRFPALQNLKASLWLALFIAFWSMWMLFFTWDGETAWVYFQFGWAGIGMLMFVMLLRMLLGYALVRIDQGQLTSVNGMLGLTRTKRIATDEIRKISIDSSLQVMGQAFHLLQVQTASGKTVSIGTRVRDRNEAEWIVLKIESALKMSLR